MENPGSATGEGSGGICKIQKSFPKSCNQERGSHLACMVRTFGVTLPIISLKLF